MPHPLLTAVLVHLAPDGPSARGSAGATSCLSPGSRPPSPLPSRGRPLPEAPTEPPPATASSL